MMKRVLTVALVGCAVFATAGTASASWTPGSSGSGSATALLVGTPTSSAASSTSSSSTTVNWKAPTAPSAAPTQYVVRRTAPTTATVCTVAATTLTCNDTGLTASTTYTYTVEALVGSAWNSGPTAGFSTTTPAPPAFTVAPASGTRTAGTAFNVTLTATTNGVTKDTTYTGAHTVVFSGPSNSPLGTAPTYPATVTFTAGVGTASVKLVTAETATLTATEASRTGSASVSVVAATSNRMVYTSSTPSCAAGSVSVGSGGSFTSKVTITDLYGNPVAQATAATIALTRAPANGTLTPASVSVAAGASQSTGSFVFTRPTGNATSVTVTAAKSGLTSLTCAVGQ